METKSKSDDRKGFKHILKKHYVKNDLETIDIINIAEVVQRGIKLSKKGVSNSALTVYMSLKKQKEHRLVLKDMKDDSFVITYYKKR